MKILGFNIQREKRSTPENPTTQYPNAVVGVGGSSENTYNGLGLLFSQLKGGGANNLSAFFRGTNLIADTIASLPIQVMKTTPDGYSEVVYDHYLYNCFDNNNSLITRFEMMKYLITSIIVRGNGYIYIERSGDGKVKSLRWLNPGDVTIIYNKVKNQLAYQCQLVSKKQIEPVNMIHVKLHSDDGINGRSIISYATRSIKLGNATEDAADKFYSSGCSLSGIIKSESVLTPQQRKDIKDSWRDSLDGSGIAVMPGNLDFKPVQMTVMDSQVLTARQFTVVDVARWLGINPVLLGDLSHSSYNTLEASQLEFFTHTLMPYIHLIEDEFTRKLFVPSEKGYYINLDEMEALRTDKKSQVSYYTSLLDKGVLSINEVRLALGYKAVEGGDKHTIAYSNPDQNALEDDKDNKNTPQQVE